MYSYLQKTTKTQNTTSVEPFFRICFIFSFSLKTKLDVEKIVLAGLFVDGIQ